MALWEGLIAVCAKAATKNAHSVSKVHIEKKIMVTLSDNATECSSTTPHLGNETREQFGSNIVSSTNDQSREFSAASAAAAAAAAVHGNPHGIWDLANSEIAGYELAASSAAGK
jgi:hypothetical protein